MRYAILCLTLMLLSCEKQVKLLKITSKGIVTSSSNGAVLPLEGLNEPQTTTFIFVRHAEKMTGDDPSLTEQGKIRAKNLADMLLSANIGRIAHTNTKRSQETAQPLITATNCGVDVYSKQAWDAYFMHALDAYRGKSVLVVGHSNTIHTMLNGIANSEKYIEIEEKDYENIYIVSVIEKGNARFNHFKF
jgi:2,3-bisphosphoglycerate-dependent phosphoglycerate mutase